MLLVHWRPLRRGRFLFLDRTGYPVPPNRHFCAHGHIAKIVRASDACEGIGVSGPSFLRAGRIAVWVTNCELPADGFALDLKLSLARPALSLPPFVDIASFDSRGNIMTRGVKWGRISNRQRMHRQGVEDSKAKAPVVVGPIPKRKLSKAELREQAEAALFVWRAARQSTTNSPTAHNSETVQGTRKGATT
jgi:hypothetical protein